MPPNEIASDRNPITELCSNASRLGFCARPISASAAKINAATPKRAASTVNGPPCSTAIFPAGYPEHHNSTNTDAAKRSRHTAERPGRVGGIVIDVREPSIGFSRSFFAADKVSTATSAINSIFDKSLLLGTQE